MIFFGFLLLSIAFITARLSPFAPSPMFVSVQGATAQHEFCFFGSQTRAFSFILAHAEQRATAHRNSKESGWGFLRHYHPAGEFASESNKPGETYLTLQASVTTSQGFFRLNIFKS
jgi:hypothetical protein